MKDENKNKIERFLSKHENAELWKIEFLLKDLIKEIMIDEVNSRLEDVAQTAQNQKMDVRD